MQLPDWELEFTQASDSLTTKHNDYISLINGGNTAGLLTAIAGLTNGNNTQIRQTLGNYSPYLTEEVIKAVLDYPSSVYPYTWQYDLVIDNIDVVKNYGFMDYLSTKSDPLPTAMIQGIEAYAASGVMTDKQVKESALSYWGTKRADAVNHIISYYKHSANYMDSLRKWITLKDEPLVKARIIDSYLERDQFEEAQQEANTLASNISTYPVHLQAELNDIVGLKSFLIDVLEDSLGKIASLTGSDLSYVQNMAANGHGIAKFQAQNILCFFYGDCADNTDIMPLQSKSQIINKDKEVVETAIKLYPNPAQNYVAIELPITSKPIQIKVYDLGGKLVMETYTQKPIYIWDTSTLPNGSYLINVIVNDGKVETEKIIIQH